VDLSLAIMLKSAAGGRYGAGLMRAHLLHIGKTGGNALKHALHPYNTGGSHDIVFHPHAVRLSDVPVGESVLFMLRNPVNRFVSGFNSRRRRGRPLNNAEWDRNEAVAFAAFPLPTTSPRRCRWHRIAAVPRPSLRCAAFTMSRAATPIGWWMSTICVRAARTFCGLGRPADLPPISSG
jgi:hypothetical protein